MNVILFFVFCVHVGQEITTSDSDWSVTNSSGELKLGLFIHGSYAFIVSILFM